MASRADQKQEARAARLAAEAAERSAATRRANLVRLGIVLALAAVAVVVAVALSSSGGGGTPKPASRSAQRSDVAALFAGIPQRGTVAGAATAPYTLIEFADLQCPICRAYTADVLPSVLRGYVRPGKVRMDLKLRTFIGPDSQTAAGVAAAAAQQSRIWPFADLFYANQGEENSGYVTADFLRRIAADTPGLDAGKALGGANGAKAQALVRADGQLASQLGSNGTPDFYLRKRGSTRLVRVQPAALTPQAFASALDSAMKLAS